MDVVAQLTWYRERVEERARVRLRRRPGIRVGEFGV